VSVALGFGADRYAAPAGNVRIAPAVHEWPIDARRSAGNVDVDLTAHPLPAAGRLDAHLGVGNLVVRVPAGAPVHVTATVGTGNILVDGVPAADGMDLVWSDDRPSNAVVVSVDVGLGRWRCGMRSHGRSVADLGFGLAYALAGVALLLQASHLVEVPWSLVVPGILLVCGVVVLASAITGQKRSR
jgi:hypothetical protein